MAARGIRRPVPQTVLRDRIAVGISCAEHRRSLRRRRTVSRRIDRRRRHNRRHIGRRRDREALPHAPGETIEDLNRDRVPNCAYRPDRAGELSRCDLDRLTRNLLDPVHRPVATRGIGCAVPQTILRDRVAVCVRNTEERACRYGRAAMGRGERRGAHHSSAIQGDVQRHCGGGSGCYPESGGDRGIGHHVCEDVMEM